jgi:hypothetical protein
MSRFKEVRRAALIAVVMSGALLGACSQPSPPPPQPAYSPPPPPSPAPVVRG